MGRERISGKEMIRKSRLNVEKDLTKITPPKILLLQEKRKSHPAAFKSHRQNPEFTKSLILVTLFNPICAIHLFMYVSS